MTAHERTTAIGPSRPPCADCGDNESTIYFERDGEWACDEPSLCVERQRDQAQERLARVVSGLEKLAAVASLEATGDDTLSATWVAAEARKVLERAKPPLQV